MKRAILLAAVVGAAAFVPRPSVAGADGPVRVGPNERLGTDARPARGLDRPGLAVDPADPSHIVAVDEDFIYGSCNHRVSFDAGRTWANGQLKAPANFPDPPCVQFDTGGWSHSDGSVAFGSGQNVYTTFTSFRPTEGDSILVARSTDGGRTFAPATVAVPGIPGGRSISIRPNLAVRPRAAGDKLVVVYWGCETPGACSGTHRAMSVSSADGGVSWALPVFLNLPTDGPAPYPSPPTVGPDGTVYVTFRRSLAAAPARATLVLATSRDDGASWTYTDIPSVDVFNQQKLIADPRDGSLYVAYHASTGGADQDIVFQRRPAGSSTWSPPLRVNDDPVGPNVAQRFPWLSLSPDGRLSLLWQDRRLTYPGNNLDDYYYATSTDGGRTFSANRRITDRSINLDVGLSNRIGTASFYWPALAPVAGGAILAAWPDSRDGNNDTDSQDLYLARLDTATGGPRPSRLVTASGQPALAAALSRLGYPGGREVGSSSALTTKPVIINEADAWAAEVGAVLARANLGPVLLARATGLPPETRSEVTRLGARGAFLLGDESRLSASVVDDLKAAGVPATAISRVQGSSAVEAAANVAGLLDTRSATDKSTAMPAFAAAVIANPASPEAAFASAMAAALRLPYLFVDAAALPQATADALRSLNIDRTLVIGGTESVSDAVQAKLPSPKRLSGGDAIAQSAAVAAESRARGLPANVAYVPDSSSPVVTAVLGAAVARLGGALIPVPGAQLASANEVITRVNLDSVVDRAVLVRVSGQTATLVQGRSKPATTPATGGGGTAPAGLALGAAALASGRLSRRARRLAPH